MPWEVGPFNILHVCRNRNIVDILLDYSVAYFDWTDRGESDLGAREVKARTRKAVMGGMGQTHLRAMSPGEITAQPIDALAVRNGLFLTPGYAVRPNTPPAIALQSLPRRDDRMTRAERIV